MNYTEDTLFQQTMAAYLQGYSGWESAYVYNNENFGPETCLVGKRVFLTQLCHRFSLSQT